jgi:hypothetical protein
MLPSFFSLDFYFVWIFSATPDMGDQPERIPKDKFDIFWLIFENIFASGADTERESVFKESNKIFAIFRIHT